MRDKQTGARVHRVPISAREVTAAAPPEFRKDRIIDLRRNKLGVSQAVLASVLNVSPETVRSWEQGKNSPGGPALRLLEIVDENPDVVPMTKIRGMRYVPSRSKAGRVAERTVAKAKVAKLHPVHPKGTKVARKR